MFIRFVLQIRHPDTGVEEGIFRTAYDFRRAHSIAVHERQVLNEALEWLGKHLPVPTRFNRTKSKGYYRRETKGVSWFKPTARDHIARMRLLVTILEENGRTVNQIITRRPGYIVYEDEHQVVAEPFFEKRG